MEVYNGLLAALQREFDTVRQLKESPRGSVCVVRHKKSGTRYVFRRFTGSGAAYRRLLTVSCPNLPQICEVGERDGATAVLEEYIQGDTLASLLAGDVLSARETKNVAMELCAALWVLHSNGVVHRDLKPENVILRGGEAVLVDFDASRVYKDESERDTQILGTLGYAAPEQYGISQSDERADIYAMGVLLNVLRTGKHPSQELASGRLGRVIQRCTMTNPKKRYQSVLHLMEAL